MAGNDYAMRFTEDKYATKLEVGRELKVSSVDPFWSNILSYRSHFYHYLTIRTIEKNMLLFCGCPAINSLVNNLEVKLIRVNREYGSETLVLGSQQYTKPGGKGRADVFKDSIKHDFRSPCYTTRWSDIPEAE